MTGETEAFKVWWALHPTLADMFLFIMLLAFITIFWNSISGNKKERKKQIEEIKTLVLSNISEIKDSFSIHINTMKEVVEKLQNEKQLIQEHLVRHEKIAEDILRICKTIDDHEIRVRAIEHWDGKERRGR